MLRVVGVMVAHLQDLIVRHNHLLCAIEGLFDDRFAESLLTRGLEAVAMHEIFTLKRECHGILRVIGSSGYASKLVSGRFLRAGDKEHDIATQFISRVLLRRKQITVLVGPGHRT